MASRPYQPWSLADTIAVGRRPSGYTPVSGDPSVHLQMMELPYIYRRRKKKDIPSSKIEVVRPARGISASLFLRQTFNRAKRPQGAVLPQGPITPTTQPARQPRPVGGAGGLWIGSKPRLRPPNPSKATMVALGPRKAAVRPQGATATMLAKGKRRTPLQNEESEVAAALKRTPLTYDGGAAARTTLGPQRKAPRTILGRNAVLPIGPAPSTALRQKKQTALTPPEQKTRGAVPRIPYGSADAPAWAPKREDIRRMRSENPIGLEGKKRSSKTGLASKQQSPGGRRRATEVADYRFGWQARKRKSTGNVVVAPQKGPIPDRAPILPRDIPSVGRARSQKTPNVEPRRDEQETVQRIAETDTSKQSLASAASKAGKRRQRTPDGEEQVQKTDAAVAAAPPPQVPSDAVEINKANSWRATSR